MAFMISINAKFNLCIIIHTGSKKQGKKIGSKYTLRLHNTISALQQIKVKPFTNRRAGMIHIKSLKIAYPKFYPKDYNSTAHSFCNWGMNHSWSTFCWSSGRWLTLISNKRSTGCLHIGHLFVWYLKTFAQPLHIHWRYPKKKKIFSNVLIGWVGQVSFALLVIV